MDPAIVSEIGQRGITYIRNLHGGNGAGLSWQQAFQTDDKKQLENHCTALGIRYEWKAGGHIRLKQPSKGITTHPQTGEDVWFSQIDQFHPYQLGEEVYEVLMSMYDSAEDLPTYVQYGDGGSISDDTVKAILATTDALTVYPRWAQNQLLIVDNVLVSHGRNVYTGDRKVLVAMTN